MYDVYIYASVVYKHYNKNNNILLYYNIYSIYIVYIYFVYVYEYNESDSLRGQRATFPFTDGARKIISSYRISARCVGPTRWVSGVYIYIYILCMSH